MCFGQVRIELDGSTRRGKGAIEGDRTEVVVIQPIDPGGLVGGGQQGVRSRIARVHRQRPVYQTARQTDVFDVEGPERERRENLRRPQIKVIGLCSR